LRKISVIVYHYVRDLRSSRFPNIKGLDMNLFREQLAFLIRNYTVIRMETLIDAVENRASLPDNAALLTFDDGYADHYTNVFPLLDKHGVQGSFFFTCKGLCQNELLDVNKIQLILASVEIKKLFTALLVQLNRFRGVEYDFPDNDELINMHAVPYHYDDCETGFVKRMLQTILPHRLRTAITQELFRQYVCVGVDERTIAGEMYCGIEHARLMKRHGMYVGVHGYGHEWLGNSGRDVYEQDIGDALDFMDSFDLIDKSSWVMNYPYGSWNDGVVDYIRSRGCVVGLTTQKAVASLDAHDRMLLPRIDTNEYPPKSNRYKEIAA
jgi:peptidoglycan/xylan/chitin deacetylase (PgdA/CDA1 family)